MPGCLLASRHPLFSAKFQLRDYKFEFCLETPLTIFSQSCDMIHVQSLFTSLRSNRFGHTNIIFSSVKYAILSTTTKIKFSTI